MNIEKLFEIDPSVAQIIDMTGDEILLGGIFKDFSEDFLNYIEEEIERTVSESKNAGAFTVEYFEILLSPAYGGDMSAMIAIGVSKHGDFDVDKEIRIDLNSIAIDLRGTPLSLQEKRIIEQAFMTAFKQHYFPLQ